ncbi:MAG: thiamine phosphate synthase [Rhodospirillaceae bacterium]|nr:thiamine phosphate synthase [Rhodospirillaceae bacterium]
MTCRLYLITPPAIEPAAFSSELERALDAGDVAAFQLRLVGAPDDDIRRAATKLMPLVQARGIAFMLDGNAGLAAELGCDGVHLDRPEAYAGARRLLGGTRMIGVSAGNSRHVAIDAAEDDADYVSFGPFFPSTTKQSPAFADPGIIRWWSELMEVPCVAVGGMTPANSRSLIEAGADFVAASGGVWSHADGAAAAVKAFNRLFSGA